MSQGHIEDPLLRARAANQHLERAVNGYRTARKAMASALGYGSDVSDDRLLERIKALTALTSDPKSTEPMDPRDHMQAFVVVLGSWGEPTTDSELLDVLAGAGSWATASTRRSRTQMDKPVETGEDGPRDDRMTCQDCERPYQTWQVSTGVWNAAMGQPDRESSVPGMLCAACFLERAEATLPTAYRNWFLTPLPKPLFVDDPDPVVRVGEVERVMQRAEKAEAERDRLYRVLIEVDTYLAALGWWEIVNLCKAGDVIGDAIGWERVAEINAAHAPKGSPLTEMLNVRTAHDVTLKKETRMSNNPPNSRLTLSYWQDRLSESLIDPAKHDLTTTSGVQLMQDEQRDLLGVLRQLESGIRVTLAETPRSAEAVESRTGIAKGDTVFFADGTTGPWEVLDVFGDNATIGISALRDPGAALTVPLSKLVRVQ